MHKCIFLSSSNYVLMQEIRLVAKNYGVEIVPCKYIFEILQKDYIDYDAIIVEDLSMLNQIDNLDWLKEKLYCLKDSKVFGLYKKDTYKGLEHFFDSKVFNTIFVKSIVCKDEDYILEKFVKLKVVFNTWQSRFLKAVLFDMQSNNIKKCNHDFIKSEMIKYNVSSKNIYNSLRPLLKQISYELNKQTGVTIKNRINNIIDDIYVYAFEEIG